MYKESYLRFSSQEYDLDNFHESVHLTNHAVQKRYSNGKQRDERLPRENMVSHFLLVAIEQYCDTFMHLVAVGLSYFPGVFTTNWQSKHVVGANFSRNAKGINRHYVELTRYNGPKTKHI